MLCAAGIEDGIPRTVKSYPAFSVIFASAGLTFLCIGEYYQKKTNNLKKYWTFFLKYDTINVAN